LYISKPEIWKAFGASLSRRRVVSISTAHSPFVKSYDTW
jgi:hypothetical protein